MSGKQENTENRLTKESIFTALMMLMEEKDYEDITITELTKKAGVSRMAYYRNYSSKDDIIVQYLDDFVKEYYQNVFQNRELDQFQQGRIFFSYFRERSRLVRNLIRADRTWLILNTFDKYLGSLFSSIVNTGGLNPETSLFKYKVEFYSAGLYKVLIAWVEGGMVESDEEIAVIALRLTGGQVPDREQLRGEEEP